VKGTIVGSYRIVDTLSVGGMGTVYRAEHTLIGRLAAVKVLHPELCANRSMVNRFFNEARATTSIKHPGIVEVFDFGYMPSGHAYLIMEFLEGMPLSQRVRQRGPIPEGEAALLLRGVCIALSAAHDKGIVHRDLKPDNIFVIPDADSALGERTKILDFGIAKLSDIGLAGGTTKTGAVMGTPTYMSPEQCRGTGDVDHRADLYSIGCIFYELVTGRPPFIGAGAGEAIGSHLFINPEPPSCHVALSAETDTLIMKLLAKQPEQRVQSAKELASLLAVIAQHHGWLAPGELSRSMYTPPSPMPTPAGPGHVAAFTPAGPGHVAAFTPATAPTTLEPLIAPGTPPDVPASLLTQKPTTLSEAASEVRQPHGRPRRRFALAIAGGLVAGGLVAIIVLGGGGPRATRPAAAPLPAAAKAQVTEPPPAAPPAQASASSAASQPSTTPTSPSSAASPSPGATPATAGSLGAPPAPATASSPSHTQPSPLTSGTRPPTPAPAATPGEPSSAMPARPPSAPTKPKKPKKGSASEPKELLEQDI
jgi:eukaryotic-like serine/threonine-protein kinase